MLTKNDFCDYDTCVALKELGFNSLVDWYFKEDKSIVSSLARYRNTYIPRISLYEAQKFLREEKKIDVLIEIECKDIHLSSKYYSIYMSYMSRFRREFSYISKNFNSYEEALSEGIKEAIKILKEK